MLIDTLKTKKRLTEDYGFSEQHAEGIIETIRSTEEQVATKADIMALRKDIWRIGFVVGGFYTGVFSLIVALFLG